MPTGEFKKLFEREFSKAAVRPIAELPKPLLQELVNSGLMIFRRCEEEASRAGKENEDVAAMALYRHVIEMVDSVEVLVANSCGTGAISVLRSAFEGVLGLLYLLRDDKKYVDRALSWPVADIHIWIKARQLLEPGTQRGELYAQLYAKEFAKVILRVPQADIAAEIQQLEQLLQTPQFTPITAEYQRTKKKLNRDPDWFFLYGGRKTEPSLPRFSVRVQSISYYMVIGQLWRMETIFDGTSQMDQERLSSMVSDVHTNFNLFLRFLRSC